MLVWTAPHKGPWTTATHSWRMWKCTRRSFSFPQLTFPDVASPVLWVPALDLLPVVVSVALNPVGRVAFEADDIFGALKVAVATGALAIALPAWVMMILHHHHRHHNRHHHIHHRHCIACLSDDDPPLSHNCTNYHRSHWYNHALLLFGYQPILKKKNSHFILYHISSNKVRYEGTLMFWLVRLKHKMHWRKK